MVYTDDDYNALAFESAPWSLVRVQNVSFQGKIQNEPITLKGKQLYYHHLPIIKESQIDVLLQKYYDNPTTTQNSALPFWFMIKKLYHGISWRRIHAFLTNQRPKQLMTPVVAKKKKSVVAIQFKYPNYIWLVDTAYLLKNESKINGGYKYLFNVIDHFSKYLWLFPMRNKDGDNYVQILSILFKMEGAPKILPADNEFNHNNNLKELFAKRGVVLIPSSPYYPQFNSAVEQVNLTIKKMIFTKLDWYDNKKWIDIHPMLVVNYNNSYHSLHNITPYEVHYGKKEVVAKALQNSEQYWQKRIFKLLQQVTPYKKGTWWEYLSHYSWKP